MPFVTQASPDVLDPLAGAYSVVGDAVAPSEMNPPPEAVQTVKADTVNLTGNVNQIEARTITVQQGGIGLAKGDVMTVSVTNGGIGAMAAKQLNVSIKDGGIGAVAAQNADVRDTVVSMLAAGKVNLSGTTRVMFDLRAGVVFGTLVGVLLAVSNLIVRLRSKQPQSVVVDEPEVLRDALGVVN